MPHYGRAAGAPAWPAAYSRRGAPNSILPPRYLIVLYYNSLKHNKKLSLKDEEAQVKAMQGEGRTCVCVGGGGGKGGAGACWYECGVAAVAGVAGGVWVPRRRARGARCLLRAAQDALRPSHDVDVLCADERTPAATTLGPAAPPAAKHGVDGEQHSRSGGGGGGGDAR